MDYSVIRGGKGMLPPPLSNYWGGGLAPLVPLFVRLCIKYIKVYASQRTNLSDYFHNATRSVAIQCVSEIHVRVFSVTVF